MKKTIAILLVAILPVGMVFADASFSGKFTSKLAYDVDENKLAFSEPDNALDLNFSLSTATENEGDVYAVVKGELTLVYESDKKDAKLDNGFESFLNTDDSKFEITEASINGQGWKLSILKAEEMPKYAKGWETYNDGDDSVELYTDIEYKDAVGLTLTLDNLLKAGVAMSVDFDENDGKSALAWVSTNDLNFAGIVVNGAVGVKKVAADPFAYLGLGLEAGYETDSLSATVASDMTFAIPTEKGLDSDFVLDVAANVNYADMVTVDAYYASQTMFGWDDEEITDSADLDDYGVDYNYEAKIPYSRLYAIEGLGRGFIYMPVEDYFSAKVGFDMNAFDVPVKLTLVAMDVVNNPYFDLEASTAIAGFDVAVYAGYQHLEDFFTVKTNNIHVGAEVAYTIEPVGKLSAKTTFLTVIPDAKEADPENAMSLELALENTTLVSGATLKAGYKTANIIDGDFIAQDKGEVYVSATIEF